MEELGMFGLDEMEGWMDVGWDPVLVIPFLC